MKMPSKFANLLCLLAERGQVRRARGEYRTRCPAHDDSDPSLYVALSPDHTCTLLNCKGGCEAEAIVAALGLGMDSLFHHDDDLVEINGEYESIDDATVGDTEYPPGELDRCHSVAELALGEVTARSPGADPDLCHEVYGRLLALLPLLDQHREDLRRRGLDDADIDRFGYKSLERFALNQAVGQLKGRIDEATLLRVPGFRRDRGRVRFVDIEGLLVPVRDLRGRIVALKVRRDDDRGGPKYVWVSSSDQGGPSPGSPPHVPLGTPTQATGVRLTEGELKGDIAWARSGLPTLGVSGVSNWRASLPILKAMGVQVVTLAFDADAWTRPGVARELVGCAQGLLDADLELQIERWDLADGKGIDNLLAASKQPVIVAGPHVLASLAELTSTAESAVEVTVSPSRAGDVEDWVPGDLAANVKPFPVECLPRSVRRFVIEAAESLQCAIDLFCLAVLVVAGAAIGMSRVLRVRDGFEEGARIYAALVARPGESKTPALRAACTPVYAAQKRLREQYRKDKETYNEDLEAYEAARKARPRPGEPPAPIPPKPIKPVMPHLYVSDVTTEALAMLLERNPRGVVKIHDELTAWVLAMNQYRGGRGTDRQFYLSCWSGEPAKVDRKSDSGEPLIVPDPYIGVIGCIPPGKLAELDAENDCEDGFVHRILFAYPAPVRRRRWSWKGLSGEVRDAWRGVVGRLYGLEAVQDADGMPAPVVLQFTPEARDVWATWYDGHFAETEAPDFPEILVGPWSKQVGYAARLALILQLLRRVDGETAVEDVEAESLRRALRLIDYFQSHARVVYPLLQASRGSTRAQQAIAWIRRNGGECHPTQLIRHYVAGLERKSEAEAMLRELADRDLGHLEMRKSKNHRNVLWFIARPVAASQDQSGPIRNRS
jgi:hypothetical protein